MSEPIFRPINYQTDHLAAEAAELVFAELYHPYAKLTNAQESLAQWARHRSNFCLEQTGQLLAVGSLDIAIDRVGLIEDLCVPVDRRGQGLGRLMMDALEQTARAARCRQIELQASPPDTAAFYRHLGYVASSNYSTRDHIVMNKSLTNSPLAALVD